jgi:tol-pal system protein YbgF
MSYINTPRPWLGLLLAVILASPPAWAARKDEDKQAMVELLRQLEVLQTEVRELRGQVEKQNHEIEQLKNRQRDVGADMDRRLNALEQRSTAAAPPRASAPSAPAAKTAPEPVKLPTTAVAGRASNDNSVLASSDDEQKTYDGAFKLLKQGYYERSAQAFRDFIVKYPHSPLADNAQYWVGEANYVTRNFKLALEEFSKVISEYPTSPKVPDALLKIGYTQYELGDYGKARETLNQVVTHHPNTTVAKSAELRLAKMKNEGR